MYHLSLKYKLWWTWTELHVHLAVFSPIIIVSPVSYVYSVNNPLSKFIYQFMDPLNIVSPVFTVNSPLAKFIYQFLAPLNFVSPVSIVYSVNSPLS